MQSFDFSPGSAFVGKIADQTNRNLVLHSPAVGLSRSSKIEHPCFTRNATFLLEPTSLPSLCHCVSPLDPLALRFSNIQKDCVDSSALRASPFEFERAKRVEAALSILEGKWKIVILNRLFARPVWRFSELEHAVPGISHRMLSQQLRTWRSARW